jgi:hypothetical protein
MHEDWEAYILHEAYVDVYLAKKVTSPVTGKIWRVFGGLTIIIL